MNTIRSGHERSYGALVFLYPRAFRREYGKDIVQLFRDDLRERGALRAWKRVLADLVLSLPVQHMEAAVTQPSTTRAAQAALVIAGMAVLAVVGIGRYVVVAVPIAVAVSATALLYLRSRLPFREAVTSGGSGWWRLVAAGAGMLAGIALVANYGPDVDWFPWHLAVFLFLAAWALMIIGAILGVVRLGGFLRRQPAGSL